MTSSGVVNENSAAIIHEAEVNAVMLSQSAFSVNSFLNPFVKTESEQTAEMSPIIICAAMKNLTCSD